MKKLSAGQFVVLALLVVADAARARTSSSPSIESGFRHLYEMRFEEGRREFLAWEAEHPEDPQGHAWEAASYLFEEFYRHGVLTCEFFLNDKRFREGVEGKPNPGPRSAFLAASKAAQDLAKQRLTSKSSDADALFTLTVTSGMLADYAALIDKRQLESLQYIRESEMYAKRLLAAKSDAADAYVALGAANYIIGSLPAHKRFLLFLGGIRGDRQAGMRQLRVAATKGNYLRPFAKVLLALVALREKQVELACTQLQELAAEFPKSVLFARELAHLQRSRASLYSGH